MVDYCYTNITPCYTHHYTQVISHLDVPHPFEALIFSSTGYPVVCAFVLGAEAALPMALWKKQALARTDLFTRVGSGLSTSSGSWRSMINSWSDVLTSWNDPGWTTLTTRRNSRWQSDTTLLISIEDSRTKHRDSKSQKPSGKKSSLQMCWNYHPQMVDSWVIWGLQAFVAFFCGNPQCLDHLPLGELSQCPTVSMKKRTGGDMPWTWEFWWRRSSMSEMREISGV